LIYSLKVVLLLSYSLLNPVNHSMQWVAAAPTWMCSIHYTQAMTWHQQTSLLMGKWETVFLFDNFGNH